MVRPLLITLFCRLYRPWAMDRRSLIRLSWHSREAKFTRWKSTTMEKRMEDNPADATFPNPVNQHPDAIPYSEEIFVGYRGYEKNHIQPLFPFGFGLSYTSFAFSNLKIGSAVFNGQAPVTVSFTV